ncbi:MAG: N-acetylmuramoyl-L-alanine amidase [Candidatus Eisenbacteria bacterium]
MRHADGRTSRLPLETHGGEKYVQAPDVSLLYGASLHWRPDLLKMTLRVGDHRVKVTAENPNVVVDGAVLHLLSPVIYRNGNLLLPLDLVVRVLAGLAPVPVRWDAEAGRLFIGSIGKRILGVRLEERPDGLDATILTSGDPEYEEGRSEGGGIVIRFPSLDLAEDSLPPPPGGNLLVGWAWEVRADSVLLHLLPGSAYVEHRVGRRVRPEGVRVRLAAAPIVDFSGAVSEAIEVLTRPKGERRGGGRIVVIDPGHGGSDTGCVLPGGASEKAIVLDLALRLREELEGTGGIRVLLTREEDAALGIRARAESANRARGDFFLSLHVNGSPAAARSGAETYVHTHGRAAEERIRKAIAEAASVYGEAPLGGALSGEIRFVPWEAVQDLHQRRSREAARLIAGELLGVEGIEREEAREAPVAVLTGADMPAVLVEVGFGTSPGEGALLSREEERTRLAEALARSIARFLGVDR